MKITLLACAWLLLLPGAVLAQYRITNPTNNEEAICRNDSNVFICNNFEDMAAGTIPNAVGGYKDPGFLTQGNFGMTILNSAQVPGGCFSGNHCMRMRTDDGVASNGSITQSWNAQFKPIGPNSYRETYWRWYQKFDNNYVWSQVGTKGLEWFSALGNGETGAFNSVAQTGLTTPGITIITNAGLVPPFDGVWHLLQNQNGAPLSWVKNQWYCLEMHLKYNTTQPDAVVEAWIQRVGVDANPVLKWSYSNFIADSHSNNSMVGLWFVTYINCDSSNDPNGQFCNEHNGNRDKYIDDIIVSTSRVNCGVTVPQPTAPNPPTNLRRISLGVRLIGTELVRR
jgi:hypothetical protein